MIILTWLGGAVAAPPNPVPANTPPRIQVIYPKEGQTIGAVDSTFILGNISPCTHRDQWQLTINGFPVPVHDSGGFIAFLPIAPGPFIFNLEARPLGYNEGDFQHRQKTPFPGTIPFTPATCAVNVLVPEPIFSYPPDTLILGPEYRPAIGDLYLTTGDRVEAWLQATPGCRAWFSIPGIVDSVPMAETDPRSQPYWGESVFGAGAVPDSLLIAGIYSGFWDLPAGVRADTLRLRYFLAPPELPALSHAALESATRISDSTTPSYRPLPDTILTDSSTWRLSINSTSFPFTVRFSDSVKVIRHGPRRGYLAIHPPEGVEALAVAQAGDWYKLKLSRTRFGWVHRETVTRLPQGIMPPSSLLRSIRTYRDSAAVRIEFPLAGKHPFRIFENNRRTLTLSLYGVTTDTDWIRYDSKDKLIDYAVWNQPEEGLYEFTIHLTKDLWGYDTYYIGNTLYLKLNRAPEHTEDLDGKTIVLDPGHSHDPGAIGPTALTEADANLGIALVLRDRLEAAGATVVLTREDTSHVDLYDRPDIAAAVEADLFISIHNNALPDGVNPLINNGTSSYYYHPHSMNLARAIHAEMTERTGLNDHGLFHGNLAVIRPTGYPAVLVECTFMLLPDQEAALKTDHFRVTVSDAIIEGIRQFLRDYADANAD